MFVTARSGYLALLAIPVGMVGATWWWPLIMLMIVAGLCLVDWLLATNPRKITVTRADVVTRLGTPASTAFRVSNAAGRRVYGIVRNGWPPSVTLVPETVPFTLDPGGRHDVEVLVSPSRRGKLQSGPITVRTAGPLGLAGRQRSDDDGTTLTVLPAFHSRRFLPSRLTRLRELEGRSLLLVSGEGTEFDSLRDYVRGDDVRSIDWRSSARRGETLVKTWRPERDRRIISVIDSGRSSSIRIGDEPRIDSSIDTTLLLAALTERSGDRLHVLAHDDQPRVRVDPARRSSLATVARALVDVEPSLAQTDWLRVAATVRATVSHRALVVMTTALDSGVVPGGLLEALPLLNRHTVLIAVATDPNLSDMTTVDGTAASAYEAAAAHRSLLEEKALASHLARLGAHVVFASPDYLPAKVADTYLDLKEAGKL